MSQSNIMPACRHFDSKPEEMLFDELRKWSIELPRTQVQMGPYRADMMIGDAVVECDGRKFHSPEEAQKHDTKRDRFILRNHHAMDIFRLPAKAINNSEVLEIAAMIICQWRPDLFTERAAVVLPRRATIAHGDLYVWHVEEYAGAIVEAETERTYVVERRNLGHRYWAELGARCG